MNRLIPRMYYEPFLYEGSCWMVVMPRRNFFSKSIVGLLASIQWGFSHAWKRLATLALLQFRALPRSDILCNCLPRYSIGCMGGSLTYRHVQTHSASHFVTTQALGAVRSVYADSSDTDATAGSDRDRGDRIRDCPSHARHGMRTRRTSGKCLADQGRGKCVARKHAMTSPVLRHVCPRRRRCVITARGVFDWRCQAPAVFNVLAA
ncbi:hypothetical protein F4861DRAFT_324421 [Xylaria intraflava]|nr:hypothetical protein F4861DRAFT_324421 [Xylaria intraflava]